MNNWKRTLYIAFFAQLMSAVGFSSSFPFLSFYVKELHSSLGLSQELAVGLVFSAQAFTMMLVAPLWGSLADRYGRKMMIMRAAFGGFVLVALMGLVSSAEQLIFLRALQGLVTGVNPAIMALVASTVPRERSGYAMGIVQMGLWGGVSAGPLMGGVIADAMGYQATYFITAALLGLSGVLIYFVKENFQPAQQSAQRQRLPQQWQGLLRLPGVVPVYVLRSFNWLARTMLVPYTPLLIGVLLPQTDNIATVTGIIAGAAAFSSTLSAYLLGNWSDKVGHRPVLIGSIMVAAVAYSLQFLVGDVYQLALLQVLTGAAVGGIIPTLSALLATYTPQGTEGAAYGLDTSILSATRSLAPLWGSFLVVQFGLRSVFLSAGLVFLVALLIAVRHLPSSPQPVPEKLSDTNTQAVRPARQGAGD